MPAWPKGSRGGIEFWPVSSLVGFATLWALQALGYAAGDRDVQALVAELVNPKQGV